MEVFFCNYPLTSGISKNRLGKRSVHKGTCNHPIPQHLSISVQKLGTDISLFLRKEKNITVDEYVEKGFPAFHINLTVPP